MNRQECVRKRMSYILSIWMEIFRKNTRSLSHEDRTQDSNWGHLNEGPIFFYNNHYKSFRLPAVREQQYILAAHCMAGESWRLHCGWRHTHYIHCLRPNFVLSVIFTPLLSEHFLHWGTGGKNFFPWGCFIINCFKLCENFTTVCTVFVAKLEAYSKTQRIDMKLTDVKLHQLYSRPNLLFLHRFT